jgi:hypothetical protein
VVRGAMLRGLQGDIVQTRIIRNNYGISFKELWDPDVHESGQYRRTAEKHKYVGKSVSSRLANLIPQRVG